MHGTIEGGESRPHLLKPARLLFAGVAKAAYPCIAIDPPWRLNYWSVKGAVRAPRYRTMTLEQIQALPIGDYGAANTFLFLWITGPFLALGAHIPLMKAWRFEP